MPGRKVPLVTDQIYHIFNRGINRQPTFITKRERQRAISLIEFYRACKPPVSFSRFHRMDDQKRSDIIQVLEKSEKLVEIFSHILMPNHFHFLLKQKVDSGISKYLSNFQNSHTKYFNVKNERDGSLFLDQFKAVKIETDEQLIHVSRYIHINSFEGHVVKSINDLLAYPWSSLPCYLRGDSSFVNTSFILQFFNNSREKYKQFILDQIDYHKRLQEIEHLLLD